MEAKKEERWNLLSPNPVGRPDTQAKLIAFSVSQDIWLIVLKTVIGEDND